MTEKSVSLSNRSGSAKGAGRLRPIVLVGLMGAGKSTVGSRLASHTKRRFFDVDDEIEQAAQLSINEIFDQYGEAYFRDGERRVIARLMEQEGSIIATGGGAFCDPETRALILDAGIAVWIDCEIETLVERTSRRDNRPLLRQGDPEAILRRLYDERQPHYAKAHIRVTSEAGPHMQTVHKIAKAIEQWPQSQ